MKVMLIEDNETKRRAITAHLKGRGVPQEDILFVKTMTDFAAKSKTDVGLFIIDFKVPNIDNGPVSPNGVAIIQTIIKLGMPNALLLAISSYPEEFAGLRAMYESHGCILADFNQTKAWKSTLDHLLNQLKKNLKFDFVIFCALQEERNPYTILSPGNQVTRGGIDCYDISVEKKSGTVVLLPQSGLVNAAVTAGVCIARFNPSVVGMSGICGGFKGHADLGQIIISSMVYEYQSGKWASDGFRHEPYQVATDHSTMTALRVLANKADLITDLEAGFTGTRPPVAKKPEVGIFTSGSAVIADNKYITQISKIHRKVSALDMEVFAIQRAAELSLQNPPCVCAKTVVDLCDESKDDALHPYGCYISAKFLIKAISEFFLNRSPC